MIVRFAILCFSVSLLACGDAQTPAPAAELTPAQHLARISSLRDGLFDADMNTDTARAYPYVRAVEAFAYAYPEHDSVPEQLMQASGIANGTNWGNKSIQLWGQVWRKHPDHPRAPEAMFYQAFVMDTKYEDYPLATQYYDLVIKTYPEHPLADQATQLREVTARGGALPPVPKAPGN